MTPRSSSEPLSTADVARLLGMSEARIRSFVRSGLCRPARRGRAYAFDFRDLVVLHAARRLLQGGVAPSRVQRALRCLAEELPEGQSLSGLRLDARDGVVTVRSGGATWDAETGQAHLHFLEDADTHRSAAATAGAAEAPGAEVVELRARDVEALVQEYRASGPVPDDAQAAFVRALSLEESDPKAAAAAYRRALELDPDLGDALINLGRLHHDAGDLGEALRHYQRALERNPLDPIVHFNLALTEHDRGGAEAAVPHYLRALELDPEFADAHFNLAQLYEELGREIDALRHYHHVRRLSDEG